MKTIHDKYKANHFKSTDMEELYKNYPDPWRLAVDGHDRYSQILFKIDELFREVGLPARILDVGSGEGVFTKMLAHRYATAHVYGFDISTTAVERSLVDAPKNMTVFQMDIGKQTLPIVEGVDVTILGDILYYLLNQQEIDHAIAELKRVVAPGGYIMLTEFLRTRKYSNMIGQVFEKIFDTRQIVRYRETPIAGVKNSQLTYRFIVYRRNS